MLNNKKTTPSELAAIIGAQKGRKGGYTTQGPQNLKNNRDPILSIPEHLHSHPNAPHFDKGEVTPYHRIYGGDKSTWGPQLKNKQTRTIM